MAHFNADNDLDANKVPVIDRMNAQYSLYVNNLPVELNEDAISDIFGQYGEIGGMFHPRNATWAYITYGTYREAELAIRELDNKKPLGLKVVLAKERSSVREEKSNVTSETFERPKVVHAADSLPVYGDMKYQSSGQSMNTPPKRPMPQVTVPHRYPDYGLCYQTPYDIDDPYGNTNQLWTRGVITVTPDGRRHVSLGRGYTQYSFPEPDPNIEQYISKIYEQRNNGSYEYSKDKLKDGVQKCSVCSTTTVKHCERCLTYYCSKSCQLEDWPRHQVICQRVPALVEETVDDMSSLKVQDLDQTKSSTPNAIGKTVKSSDLKLRRPNKFNTMQGESSNNTSVNINMQKSNTDVAHNSVKNDTQEKHAQHDKDINVSHTKSKADEPVNSPTVANATNNTKEFSHHRLRRYNNGSPDHSRRNNYASSPTDQSHHNRNYQSDSNKISVNKERCDNNNVRDRTYNNDRNRPQRNGNQSDRGSPCSRENINKSGTSTPSNTSVNNDLAFYKDTHLSKTKFITVEVVITLSNDEYWIYKLEDEDVRRDLMIQLQDVANKSRKVQPIIGEVYGVMYDSIWYRAMVLALNPTKVHYIDFGNDEILEKDAVIKDIGDMIKSPKFARKIRLTPGTSNKYKNLQPSDKLSVRMLSTDSEKTIIVEVQEQSETLRTTESISDNPIRKLVPQENSEILPNKIKASTTRIPNVLDDLMNRKAGSEVRIDGFIQINEPTQKNVYTVSLCPNGYQDEVQMIFEDLQEECKDVQTANYKPKTEDLICFKWSDGWFRGYVLTSPENGSSNWSIYAVDEARILSVDQVFPCPEKFSNICTFGVICEISNSTVEMRIRDTYEFTATLNEKDCKQDCLKIEIIVDSEVVPAVVRPWKLTNTNSLSLFELKNGSKVCLTSYRNHYYMFARSLDDAAVEYYNHVMQSVARFAQTAPRLTELPINKKIVIAPFEDGNSYRAMIMKIQDDKAMIVYIDFGNVAAINIKDLQEMPECPSLNQSCSAKIMLKDVPHDLPNNEEVDIYLRKLVGHEEPLICTFEGASSKDGVCLTTLTGESINDQINRLLIPGWKRGNSDNGNTCYLMEDMKVASLGNVGDTVNAMVLFQRDKFYMMSPCDIELMTYIFDVLPAMLKEYCETMEYYIPRTTELCLALYDGVWYRAGCFNPRVSSTTAEIFFVDYGNTELVEHANVRLMPKDYITPAALANVCTVVNLAPVDKNGEYSKAIQLKLKELVQQNTQVKIKIVECLENGDYKIELPDVRAELVKQALV